MGAVLNFKNAIAFVTVLISLGSCGAVPQDKNNPSIEIWVAPEYSKESHSAGLSGIVEVRVLVKSNGEAGNVEILKGTGFAVLDEAALASVLKCKFRPAVQNGQAVESWLIMNCNFPPNSMEGLPCTEESGNPRLVYWVQPQYPEQARRAGQEGEVVVKVLVLEDGSVGNAEVLNGPGHNIIEEAAVRAALECIFEPGVLSCKPVKAWMALPFNFHLK